GDINGKRVCSFGDISTTSFFPAKPLGCYGDGGAIFTDDDEIATILTSLKAQGRSPEDKYDNRAIGMNSRLDTLQAAILQVKLKAFIDYELEAVNTVAEKYTVKLRDIVETPYIPEGYYSSWAQYTIKLKDEKQRDGLKTHLQSEGIPSMVYYPRGLHQQTAYKNMNISDSLMPVTSDLVNRVLSLPMHPYLTDADIDKIVSNVIGFLNK
ncbi:MAG TPA: aminotransferase DegT, partial [Christensenellaceae bacterium]|nr:aminotransferase DegT [Christensenellaceae bacterium]